MRDDAARHFSVDGKDESYVLISCTLQRFAHTLVCPTLPIQANCVCIIIVGISVWNANCGQVGFMLIANNYAVIFIHTVVMTIYDVE